MIQTSFTSLATKFSGIHVGFDKLSQWTLAELVEANTFCVHARRSNALDLKPETRPLNPCLKSKIRPPHSAISSKRIDQTRGITCAEAIVNVHHRHAGGATVEHG